MEQINVIECTNEGSDFSHKKIAECKEILEQSERILRNAEIKETKARMLNRLSIAYSASVTLAATMVIIYILARTSYILALWS